MHLIFFVIFSILKWTKRRKLHHEWLYFCIRLSMPRGYDYIKDLKNNLDIWKIGYRVIDSWIVTGSNENQHMELIIADVIGWLTYQWVIVSIMELIKYTFLHNSILNPSTVTLIEHIIWEVTSTVAVVLLRYTLFSLLPWISFLLSLKSWQARNLLC